jgi:hypothetical protein
MPAICEVFARFGLRSGRGQVCDPAANGEIHSRRTAVPIGAIRSLTTEVGAGRSVPGATAALGTPSLPKGAPGSVFALYVPQSPDFEPPLASPGVGFYFLFTSPNEGNPL